MKIKLLKTAAVAGLAALLAGCAGGYVEGGGGYGGPAVVGPAPDFGYGPDYDFYGGAYERGRDVHAFSDRGFHSREAAHPGAFAGHAGGGGAVAHGGGGGGGHR